MKIPFKLMVTAALTIKTFTFSAGAQVASNPPYTLDESVIVTGAGTTTGSGNIYTVEGNLGQAAAGTESGGGTFALRGGFISQTALSPTAASARVSGRVLTADGRGIRNAVIVMTNLNGALRTAQSSSFGVFTFENVPVGEVYVVSVRARRYQFSQNAQVFSVMEDVTGINFIADAQ